MWFFYIFSESVHVKAAALPSQLSSPPARTHHAALQRPRDWAEEVHHTRVPRGVANLAARAARGADLSCYERPVPQAILPRQGGIGRAVRLVLRQNGVRGWSCRTKSVLFGGGSLLGLFELSLLIFYVRGRFLTQEAEGRGRIHLAAGAASQRAVARSPCPCVSLRRSHDFLSKTSEHRRRHQNRFDVGCVNDISHNVLGILGGVPQHSALFDPRDDLRRPLAEPVHAVALPVAYLLDEHRALA